MTFPHASKHREGSTIITRAISTCASLNVHPEAWYYIFNGYRTCTIFWIHRWSRYYYYCAASGRQKMKPKNNNQSPFFRMKSKESLEFSNKPQAKMPSNMSRTIWVDVVIVMVLPLSYIFPQGLRGRHCEIHFISMLKCCGPRVSLADLLTVF